MIPAITIAIFPLQLVIFPGESIPLHIFEPRYKQLILESRDDGINFAIPTVLGDHLSTFATEVELVEITKTYDDGEMDILVRGTGVVRINEVLMQVEGKLYSGATVTRIEQGDDADPTVEKRLRDRVKIVAGLIKQKNPIEDDEEGLLSYRIAPHVTLSLREKVDVLSMESEAERQLYLLRHLDKVVHRLRRIDDGQKSSASNGRSGRNGSSHG